MMQIAGSGSLMDDAGQGIVQGMDMLLYQLCAT
jgi:hypothetical protein